MTLAFETQLVSTLLEYDARTLAKELLNELPEDHMLDPIKTNLKAVDRIFGRDDIFVSTDIEKTPFAIEHLTWRKETDARWPRTNLYPSLEAVHEELREMLG